MATQQGYSGVVTNGLVFAFDIGDTTNSYKGEPTTNLIPTATINALPTYNNGWGTYNTNQYNGGNYFSIGSISSVSSNIVTTTTGHPLRTFDVVTPQTTGGGVTAGTNYLVRKWNSTQFSLYAYNGSQDGSQGYINLSTGWYKVQDDYATDTRVAVNASSFPTMWWGPPHLPNSGLIKEIIPNGFVDPTTGYTHDCIRLHWYRPDGVTDGMAYGADMSFSANQDLTPSFWMKAVDNNAVSKYVNFYHYTYNVTSPTAYSMNAYIGEIGVWQKYSYTFNSPNNVAISYWFPSYGPMTVDIANIQGEQKSHTTPFTTGTRSSTQGLIDLTGNYLLDLTNAGFDTKGNLTFNGTSNYVTVNNSTNILSGTQDFTIEAVYNNAGSSTADEIFGNYGSGYSTGLWFSGKYGIYLQGGSVYVPGAPITGGRYHMAATRQSGTVNLYLNGSLVNSGTLNGSIPTNINYRIGADVNSFTEPFTGQIYSIKTYSRALSQGEIYNNYLHYKTRFNLP